MNKTFRQIARFSLFLATGILLLYLAFRGIDFSEIVNVLLSAKFGWVGLSLFFAILAHLSRARRWIILIEPLKYRPGLWNTFNAVMVGYLANYALPRIGEVTRCVTLGKKEKIPVDKLIGTVVIERAIDLVSILVILVVLLVVRFEKFGAFFREYIFIPIGEKVSSVFGEALIFWIIIAGAGLIIVLLLYVFRKKLKALKITQKIGNMLVGILEGLKTLGRLERKWEFVFFTVFIWLNYALMTWVVVFSLPEITGDLKFVDGIFLLVIGTLGMTVPVQSGIGAFHWIVSRGLFFVYGADYGIDLSEGLAFATLQHESQTLLILLLGSFSMLFLFAKVRRREP